MATGILVGLLLLEISVRLFMPQNPAFFDSNRFERYSDEFPGIHENIPNSRSDSYIGVPVQINSLGLRGDETSVRKPQATVRIIGVGDSITFGYGVRLENTFLKLLETRLNQHADGKHRFEVLNAGVPATGLDYYYHFLAVKAPTLQPDGIIVGICLNDIRTYGEPSRRQPTKHATEWLRSLAMLLSRHSQLFLASYLRVKSALYGLGVLDINQLQDAELLVLEAPSPRQEAAWQSSLQMLAEIGRSAKRQNVPLLLVVFPLEMQLSPETLKLYRDDFHVRLGADALAGGPQVRLRNFAIQHGIPFLDLLPAFRAHIGTPLYQRNKSITYDPVHPSAVGNRIVADEILKFLECADPNWMPAVRGGEWCSGSRVLNDK